jgi:hypothetical protein
MCNVIRVIQLAYSPSETGSSGSLLMFSVGPSVHNQQQRRRREYRSAGFFPKHFPLEFFVQFQDFRKLVGLFSCNNDLNDGFCLRMLLQVSRTCLCSRWFAVNIYRFEGCTRAMTSNEDVSIGESTNNSSKCFLI